ncbi:hypothetical protein MMYC01_202027 [Madurella mycetomatis]|uniref:Uncharacterized protein n=1 Tax=Madurella mycetomatis TaxID=100816 RepID=A0A175WDN3_9PEZI|nr:hypothetical protein MMYC01_202027 [Madurella mycetomatis]
MWALAPKTLDISPNLPGGNGSDNAALLSAFFDLGVIHGTVQLSLSEQAIREFVRGQEVLDADQGSEKGRDGFQEEHEEGAHLGIGRKAATAHPANDGLSAKMDRFYFAFRCRNSLSAIVYPEARAGYVDFVTDGQWEVTSFRGRASFPC